MANGHGPSNAGAGLGHEVGLSDSDLDNVVGGLTTAGPAGSKKKTDNPDIPLVHTADPTNSNGSAGQTTHLDTAAQKLAEAAAKQVEAKQDGAMQAEAKQLEAKQAEAKLAEAKEAEAKQAGAMQAEVMLAEAKQAEAKAQALESAADAKKSMVDGMDKMTEQIINFVKDERDAKVETMQAMTRG